MMVPFKDGNSFYMEKDLYNNLQTLKKAIKDDWDFIFLVDGYEGSGKSVIAQQCAYVCDSTFNIDRIVFNHEDFRKAVLHSNKYEAIIFDEAYTDLSSSSTLTAINRSLCGMLTEIRQKNLFIFIVCPSFFDITRYVAVHRSQFLIHCKTEAGFSRGHYKVYTRDKKKVLYLLGKKTYSYSEKTVKRDFRGNFRKFYTVDSEEYKKRKEHALAYSKIDTPDTFQSQRNSIIYCLHKIGMATNDILKYINWYSDYKMKSPRTLRYLFKRMEEEEKQEDLLKK